MTLNEFYGPPSERLLDGFMQLDMSVLCINAAVVNYGCQQHARQIHILVVTICNLAASLGHH